MTSVPLENLLATVLRMVPDMAGRIDDAPLATIHLAGRNDGAIRAMYNHCKKSFPDAGKYYCGLRCWGQLIWQPIYLSVIAVYHGTTLPLLRHFHLLLQHGEDGLIAGFAMRRHTPQAGTQEQRARWACRQLTLWCDRLRDDLSSVVKVNPHAASCMQADCMLQALLTACSGGATVPNEQLHERGEYWLKLSGLTGHSSYFEFAQEIGAELKKESGIAVRRQTCCHQFRCPDAKHCCTCPKLSIDERISRLTLTAQ